MTWHQDVLSAMNARDIYIYSSHMMEIGMKDRWKTRCDMRNQPQKYRSYIYFSFIPIYGTVYIRNGDGGPYSCSPRGRKFLWAAQQTIESMIFFFLKFKTITVS